MSFFPDSRNPSFYNCNFTNQQSPSALQVLLGATAPGAAYNSEERHPHPVCLPHTRIEIRGKIQEWAETAATCILWLHGPAGAGKSAVAQSMCEAWAKREQLIGSFFFSRSSSTRHTLERLIPTIACQMVYHLTNRLDVLIDEVARNPQILTLEASKQLVKLLIEPIGNFLSRERDNLILSRRYYLVLDGLDECQGSDDQRRVLDLLHTLVTSPLLGSLQLYILISSRPESHIRLALNRLPNDICSTESLSGDLKDVQTYLEHSFREIHGSDKHHAMMQHVSGSWPAADVIQTLSYRSGGYFIYASTVVRYVDEEGCFCVDRLNEVLYPTLRPPGPSLFMELDKLYTQVLSSAKNTDLTIRILQCIIVGRQMLVGYDELADSVTTTGLVSMLLSLRPGELEMGVSGLHSIIRVSNDRVHNLVFYHASFSDYLLEESRLGAYHIDYEKATENLFLLSLGLMHLTGSPSSFAPTREWAVAMLSWTRLSESVSADCLVKYMQSIDTHTPISPEFLFREEEPWPRNEEHRFLVTLVKLVVSLENIGISNNHLQTQIKDLLWTCHINCLTFFGSDKEDYTVTLCLRLLREIEGFKSLPITSQVEELQAVLEGVGDTATLAHLSQSRLLRLIIHVGGEQRRSMVDDCRINLKGKDGRFKLVDVGARLVQMLESIMTRFVEEILLINSAHAAYTVLKEGIKARSSTWTTSFKDQLQPRDIQRLLYRSSSKVRRISLGEYGLHLFIMNDGLIECNTYWRADSEYLLSKSQSASSFINWEHFKSHNLPSKRAPLTAAHDQPQTQCDDWRVKRRAHFQRLAPPWREYWEETQRRHEWLEGMFSFWLDASEGDAKAGTRNVTTIRQEWQKLHDSLRDILKAEDPKDLEAWIDGEAERQQQWLEIEDHLHRDERERNEEWKLEEKKIQERIRLFQQATESRIGDLPEFKAALAYFGDTWVAVQWTHWRRREQMVKDLAGWPGETPRRWRGLPEMSNMDWGGSQVVTGLIEQEAKRRALWDEVAEAHILTPDLEQQFLQAHITIPEPSILGSIKSRIALYLPGSK